MAQATSVSTLALTSLSGRRSPPAFADATSSCLAQFRGSIVGWDSRQDAELARCHADVGDCWAAISNRLTSRRTSEECRQRMSESPPGVLTSYKQACWMLGASETDSPTLARWLRRFVFKCVAEMHNQSGLADQFVEDMVHEPAGDDLLPEDSVAFRQEAILVAHEPPFQDALRSSEGDRAVARLFASVRQKGHID